MLFFLITGIILIFVFLYRGFDLYGQRVYPQGIWVRGRMTLVLLGTGPQHSHTVRGACYTGCQETLTDR